MFKIRYEPDQFDYYVMVDSRKVYLNELVGRRMLSKTGFSDRAGWLPSWEGNEDA